ncbi:DUF1642 domain-containing protein [Streptococcus parauberis]|uniref:DUF1642 domain-containing protein n=1 Tax=Streptococcus parauberis TaxID=1348 RepID=UPI000C14FDEE|nr:DUF1642 domain-containing protein [Streptococcus parauberis]PIA83680.1 hypothetical protein ADO07_01548 [Streptococcus parauberis]
MKIEEAKLGQTVYVKGIITDIDKDEIFDLEIHTPENDFFVNSEDVFLKLDQPKLVVPQDVGTWFKSTDDPLNDYINLVETMHKYDGKNPNYNYDTGMYKWIRETPNSMQIVVNMHQFGYEVEKEKLYVVKVLGCTLFKMTSDNHTKYKLVGENETPLESKCSGYKFEGELTEKEIKQADERLWQWTRDVTE